MVHLHQIANHDFLLFSADQTVNQAREAVGRLNPTGVVVRRWDGSAAQDYYLYIAQKFVDHLAQADSSQLLMAALQLHESSATPALDIFQDAETAPERCVITCQLAPYTVPGACGNWVPRFAPIGYHTFAAIGYHLP